MIRFTGISDDIAASLTYSKASSLLVGTKARVDPHTYSWIRKTRFEEPGLVLLVSDLSLCPMTFFLTFVSTS